MSPDILIGIPFQKFTCGARAPVDLYIELGEKRYVKVVPAGEQFDRHRLQLNQNQSDSKIFIQKKEFSLYLTYCIELSKRMFSAGKKNGAMDFELSGRVTELLYTGFREMGFTEPLAATFNDLTEVIAEQSKEKECFSLFLSDLTNINDQLARHSFATTLFTLVIINGLGWRSEANLRSVTLGALLHDVGLLNHSEMFTSPKANWSEKSVAAYSQHPQAGASLLLEKSLVKDERVIRIISDHEELPDGSGFPNGLQTNRIFPMALPVIMADRLADLMTGIESPLAEKSFSKALTYLRNREERFYPEIYWNSIEAARAWIS